MKLTHDEPLSYLAFNYNSRPYDKVRLDWKTGIAVADWEKIAKASNVDGISNTLRALEAELKEIHTGMLFLRAREAELRDLNEAGGGRRGSGREGGPGGSTASSPLYTPSLLQA